MSKHDRWTQAVRTLLEYIGEDPDREGLRDTPRRFLEAWQSEWGRGYTADPTLLTRLFREDGQSYDSMVLVRHIKLWSHCEHHIAPFFGTADIAYLPDPTRGIVGISKLARIVDHFSRRLQVQERLGVQIADFITEHVSSLGAGVVIRATHTCMCSRGVNQAEALTVTSALRGAFFSNQSTRDEFFGLTNR